MLNMLAEALACSPLETIPDDLTRAAAYELAQPLTSADYDPENVQTLGTTPTDADQIAYRVRKAGTVYQHIRPENTAITAE